MEALTQARERQEEARRLYEQKRDDLSVAETIFNDTIKDKAEALEKHVKTVTMRAKSVATTEADFFKTLFDRHTKAQKHRHELTAQLSQQNTTTHPTQQKILSAEKSMKT